MHDFAYHTPASLPVALELLQRYGEEARVVAGGTALVLLMKQGLAQPAHLVSLARIPHLDTLLARADGLHIGATCTHRQVETSPLVRRLAPLLAETYRHVATVKVRTMATVGGGLAHGDPNQDPPPALLALDARLRLRSAAGQREVPLTEFFRDYFETALRPGEVLTEVVLPPLPSRYGAAFLKFLPRTADDYATVSAAALVVPGGDGALREVRLALGSVGVTPVRAAAVEAALRGQRPTPQALREAAELVRHAVEPLDDWRGSAAYKRDMAVVFARRALEQAVARLGDGSS